MARRGARLALGALCAATTALSSVGAEAANLTVMAPSGGTNDTERTTNTAFYISRQDCLDNVEFTFPVGVTGTGNFEVWASETADCTISEQRTATSGCHLVLSSLPVNNEVRITAQQMVAALGVDGTTCDDTSISSLARSLKLYFLLLTGEDPVVADNFYLWTDTKVDLLGPAAPTTLGIGAGDSILLISLPESPDSDTYRYFFYCAPLSNATNTNDAGSAGGAGGAGGTGSSSSAVSSSSAATSGAGGAGGMGGMGGAGGMGGMGGMGGTLASSSSSSGSLVSSSSSSSSSSSGEVDAGDGDGSTSEDGGASSTCPAGAFIKDLLPGTSPANPKAFKCAETSSDAVKATLEDLKNNTTYVVAVASLDEVGNVGPLSPYVCGAPAPTDTFFKDYCQNGGLACPGCGLCNVGGDTVGDDLGFTWSALGLSSLAALGLIFRRKARRGGHKVSERE